MFLGKTMRWTNFSLVREIAISFPLIYGHLTSIKISAIAAIYSDVLVCALTASGEQVTAHDITN